MTGRKDARTSQKHLDILSAFSEKPLVRIFNKQLYCLELHSERIPRPALAELRGTFNKTIII